MPASMAASSSNTHSASVTGGNLHHMDGTVSPSSSPSSLWYTMPLLALMGTVASDSLEYDATPKAKCEAGSSPNDPAATDNDDDDDDDSTSLSSSSSSPAVRSIESYMCLGVNEEDVEELVEELLKDPSVNIPLIPDAIEAQLYKSTIILTLNAVYAAVGGLQGTRLLSHELQLNVDRRPRQPRQQQQQQQGGTWSKALAEGAAHNVNDDILRQVAERLLTNPAVNAAWIPNAVETQIYVACLQVVFRILHVVLSSLRLQLCGHELTLGLHPVKTTDDNGLSSSPSSSSDRLGDAALAVASELNSSGDDSDHSTRSKKKKKNMTPLDLDLLCRMAKKAGVDEETNNDWWWNRIFTQSDMVRQLHASLYGLILGILDDAFCGQLQLSILSDTIQLDLVPSPVPFAILDQQQTPLTSREGHDNSSSGVGSFAAASFAAGIGVGVTVMAVMTNHSSR